MKIAIGSDHAGFQYKEAIKQYLTVAGHEVIDKGAFTLDPGDAYPTFCRPAAKAVPRGEADRAIVLGGSGNGEAIVANRVSGMRCALCWNVETARLGRMHNDANCISIGERMVDLPTALEIVRVWLETPFEGGRHAERIAANRRLIKTLLRPGRGQPRRAAGRFCLVTGGTVQAPPSHQKTLSMHDQKKGTTLRRRSSGQNEPLARQRHAQNRHRH